MDEELYSRYPVFTDEDFDNMFGDDEYYTVEQLRDLSLRSVILMVEHAITYHHKEIDNIGFIQSLCRFYKERGYMSEKQLYYFYKYTSEIPMEYLSTPISEDEF
jgi:hypothetical protein